MGEFAKLFHKYRKEIQEESEVEEQGLNVWEIGLKDVKIIIKAKTRDEAMDKAADKVLHILEDFEIDYVELLTS
ncbi:MAG: hypothetical protein ACE5FT_05575 [Candidatus Nanoarchaeia archaeon]